MSKSETSIQLTSPAVSKRFGIPWPALSLIAICVALAFYFCSLQTTYYQHYQPFFDSLSYYNEIHLVMTAGQNEGISSAFTEAIDSRSTVFMPRLIAALVSPIFSPSRNFAVWVQMAELFLLMASLMYYYRSVHNTKPWTSLLLVLPLTLMSFMYQRHGGVSDFRMDFSLYTTYAMACVWYLIAANSMRRTHFFTLGVVVALACLFRATAPVYLVIALVPPAIFQLWFSQQRWPFARGLAVATVTAMVGCLWFFVVNFDVLHHYYFVWNTDANAKLPISDSWKHIKFTVRHMGDTFWCWLLVMNVMLLWFHGTGGGKSFRSNVNSYLKTSARQVDLRLLWFGVAPLAMLVLRGAGLNPYVCLPAVAGLYLFLMDGFAKDQLLFRQRSGTLATTVAFALVAVVVLFEGVHQHEKGNHQSMAAHKKIISTMMVDAKQQGLKRAAFDSSYVFFINAYSLVSTLRFDTPEAKFDRHEILVNDIQVGPRAVFSNVVANADWSDLSGTDREKLDSLVNKANEQLDYLVLPVDATAQFLQLKVSHNIINRHQTYLRQSVLADDRWEKLGEPVKNRTDEVVQLYRNNRRIAIAKRRNERRDVKVRQAKTESSLR